jgi:hypothetical protein
MNQVERPRDGLERLIDGWVALRLLLKERQSLSRCRQRRRPRFAARRALRCFDAVERAHRVRNGLGHGHDLRRDNGVL